MKNTRQMLTFLIITVSLSLLLSSMAAYAGFTYGEGTASSPAQGCVKTCDDGVLDPGEDCELTLT